MHVLLRQSVAIIGSMLLLVAASAAAQEIFVPVRAVLRTSPEAIQNVVHLPVEGGALGFFLDESIGEIVEYRIDLDITQDSDGDGITDNDADNSFHSSYHSGGTFPVSLRPAPGETAREVQLKVFDASGTISQARLTVRFDGAMEQPSVLDISLQTLLDPTPPPVTSPDPPAPSSLAPATTQAVILADRATLHIAEQFTLRIENAPEGTVQYQWDLQGDGQVDTQTTIPSVVLEPDAPGVLPVRVTFVGAAGETLGVITEQFTVALPDGGVPAQQNLLKDTLRIDVTTQETRAEFRLVLNAPLAILELEPTWDFGDGQRSYLLEPTHTYEQGGTYLVSVSLRDVRSKQEVAAAETEVIVTGAAPKEPKEGSGVLALILKPFVFLFKVVLFVLFLLLLVAGVVFLWLMREAKKQNIPIAELAQRYKHKFLHEEEVIQAEPTEKKEEDAVIDVESTEEAKEEPAPMKIAEEELQVEESAVEEATPSPEEKKDEAPPPAPAEPPKEAPLKEPAPTEPAPAPTEEGVLPSWLAEGQETPQEAPSQEATPAPVPSPEPPSSPEVEEPAPSPPPPSEPPPKTSEPASPPPQKTSDAPSWLDQGLTGATEEEKKQVEEGVVATPEPAQEEQPKKQRTPEEQERIREKRRRYRKNKRAREKAARENGGEQKEDDSDQGGDDEPLAFIKAEDVPE